MKIGMKIGALAFAAVTVCTMFAATGCTVHEDTRVRRPVVEEKVVVRERPVVRENVYVR